MQAEATIAGTTNGILVLTKTKTKIPATDGPQVGLAKRGPTLAAREPCAAGNVGLRFANPTYRSSRAAWSRQRKQSRVWSSMIPMAWRNE